MSELDYLERAACSRAPISRREFMGRAAALGASSLAISTMLASADAIAAETPKKGGTAAARPRRRQHDRQHRRHVSYNDSVMIDDRPRPVQRLVEWGQDGKPHPELAESLEPKNGAKDWIFNLRKGDQVLERPGIHRRRRHLFAEPASRRHQVRRRRHDEAGHRRQEARQVPDPDFARRAPTPTCPTR